MEDYKIAIETKEDGIWIRFRPAEIDSILFFLGSNEDVKYAEKDWEKVAMKQAVIQRFHQSFNEYNKIKFPKNDIS